MTWGEFKKIVEAEGVTDDMKINWIDVGPFGKPYVEMEDDNRFSVSE